MPSGKPFLYQHTISSLQIGQTIRELAAAAAWAEAWSPRATREVRSSLSVDRGVLEAWELSDTELSDGESRSVGRDSGFFATGGARFFPLPRTLPPPRLLLAAIISIGTTYGSLSGLLPAVS